MEPTLPVLGCGESLSVSNLNFLTLSVHKTCWQVLCNVAFIYVAGTVKVGLQEETRHFSKGSIAQNATLIFLLQMLPLNTNIREAYAFGQDQEQNFIQNLAMFLCTYLKEHGTLVEKKQLNDVLMKVRKLL